MCLVCVCVYVCHLQHANRTQALAFKEHHYCHLVILETQTHTGQVIRQAAMVPWSQSFPSLLVAIIA